MKELKHDELAETARWSQQAKAVQGNVFRWLAQTRDTAAVSTRTWHNSALAGSGRLRRYCPGGDGQRGVSMCACKVHVLIRARAGMHAPKSRALLVPMHKHSRLPLQADM